MPERLLSTAETADRLGIPEATLRYWRSVEKGPRGKRIGSTVKYREADVDTWIREQFEAPAVAG